jgi:type I site-specific restriction-modification system R (restriction) subunit
MAQTLARFTITKAIDDSFMLHIEDDSGTTLELEASYDQLDLIVEAIDEQLSADVDDHDEVEDDDIKTDDD